MTLKLGVLASGSGSNLQAIIDACNEGTLDAEVTVVISNNSGSGALQRAREAGIYNRHLSSKTSSDEGALDRAIRDDLQSAEVDVVVLAGYMKKVGPATLNRYKGRILNIHPALLPDFGGPGMFGEKVHQAVLASGATRTGVTIHIADEQYDRGPVLAQHEVPVLEGDDAQTLARRVLEQEHLLYVETLRRIASGDLTLP